MVEDFRYLLRKTNEQKFRFRWVERQVDRTKCRKLYLEVGLLQS